MGDAYGDPDGRAWVMPTGLTGVIGLADVATATILGPAFGETYGTEVSFVGDINGDGCDDFTVGNERLSLFYGPVSGTLSYEDAGLDAWGSALVPSAAAGDLNGDGFDDLVVGNQNWGYGPDPLVGAVYTLLGG